MNQALAAVELLYTQGPAIRTGVARARVTRPGEPDAFTDAQAAAVGRAADRRGARDAAIIALLRYTGARVEEAARLDLVDVAITARTGTVRLHGKGDQVRTVPLPAPARTGSRPGSGTGPRCPARTCSDPAGRPGSGSGSVAGLPPAGSPRSSSPSAPTPACPGLRPHRLRHTYGTCLRHGGADPAQIQALMGDASIDTTARYFRAGSAEVAGVVDRIFEP